MATEKKDRTHPFKEIRRIAELSHDGFLVYDLRNKRIDFLNDSLVQITEVARDVLIEDPTLLLKNMSEEEQDYLTLRFAELMNMHALEEVQIRFPLGKVQKTLSLSGYLSSEATHLIVVVKDITKPKEHEDYLINFGAKKDAILDSVAQSLSTPLNLSQFTVDLIEKAVRDKKFHKINAHTALIREVTGECIRIIEHFMREEHMVSPDIYTKSNRFDLVGKVTIVLDELKRSHPDKRFRIESDSAHIFVTGDDLKFFQIVHNLLSNAIKFTRSQGHIHVIVKNKKQTVQVIVQDDGIGIPEALQPFIFDKDTKAARPGLNGEASIGIGLYVSKKLTELLNGRISFESKENAGARFTLEIPKS